MSAFTVESIRRAARQVSGQMQASFDELNSLDAALGDGDLGVNLTRAFGRLVDDLPNLPDDVSLALLRCAQAFTKVSASTYGTLLATGLMAAARLTRNRNAVEWAEVSSLLEAARNAMSDRGKGQLGDKTVLDAVEAARQATIELEEPAAMAAAASRAIDEAIKEFRDRPFRQGRARIFGASALGRDDPGMVAFKRIVESLRDSSAAAAPDR